MTHPEIKGIGYRMAFVTGLLGVLAEFVPIPAFPVVGHALIAFAIGATIVEALHSPENHDNDSS